jgi:diguanylate cyclase (GGDEF)-like protein/PAS domain S-box-containing protein
MKTKVFLREEQRFKEVDIAEPVKAKINDKFLNKWKGIVNIIANIIGVAAALIMKVNPESMEVVLKSQNEDNPYITGGSDSLGHGLYCETVIAKNKELHIKNALEDEVWKDNPDIDLNMISYYGLPLNWPDGKTFGTICILDDKSMELNKDSKQLMKEFKNVIEDDLNQLDVKIKLKEKNDKISEQKDKLKWIIEAADVGTWELNLQTGETICNKKWAEMLGYELEELEPKTIKIWEELTHPEDLKKGRKVFEKHLNGEIDFYRIETRLKHKDGHWVWMLGMGKVISWTDDGRPHKMFGMDIDISKQKKQEQIIRELHKVALEFQNLANEREICQKTIETAREILEFDLSHILLVKNDKFVPTAVSEGMKAETLPLDFGIAGKAFKNNESYLTLDTEKDPDATPAEEIYKSGITVPMRDIGVFQAISTEKNAFNQRDLELAETLIASTKAVLDKLYYQKELEHKSFHDSLTNLYNRRFFEEEMKRLDTKRQLPLSIIMADVNGLKIINDSYGHEKGDQILIKAAEILKEALREEDILARQGGDEFAVLLPKTNNEQLSKIIKRIKDKINQVNNQADMPISIALGSAIKKDPAKDINEVLKRADDDMYQNKLSESKSSKSNIIENILNTLSSKTQETKEHAERMEILALELGEKISLCNSELNRLALLAKLHDIGKITISEEILTKPKKLTEEEWDIMIEHPTKGYRIASGSKEFAVVAKDILAHHEHWDGSGYPRGLSGEEIPYLARIISIIDAYDVMTNERPYSKAISKEEALAEINSCAGSQFDPELAGKFVKMMK